MWWLSSSKHSKHIFSLGPYVHSYNTSRVSNTVMSRHLHFSQRQLNWNERMIFLSFFFFPCSITEEIMEAEERGHRMNPVTLCSTEKGKWTERVARSSLAEATVLRFCVLAAWKERERGGEGCLVFIDLMVSKISEKAFWRHDLKNLKHSISSVVTANSARGSVVVFLHRFELNWYMNETHSVHSVLGWQLEQRK